MATINAKLLGEIAQRIADNCAATSNLESGDARGHNQNEITKDLKELVKLVGIDNLRILSEEE